jgi:sortase A
VKKAVLIIFVVLFGVGLFVYPHVATYFSDKNASGAVQSYAESVNAIEDALLAEKLAQAQKYNKELSGETIQDPFIPGSGMVLGDDYMEVLNVNGVMGYIYIPKIDIRLAIYHGTSEETLQRGAGHLEGSSLPIGGPGSHTVLTGHSGLTNARMFTDLVELTEGDTFYLHVLSETLAYRVDQIKIIEPSNTDDLRPIADADYATLITCTPYGVNSHRLLVRGARVAYSPETEKAAAKDEIIDGWTSEDRTLFRAAAITAAAMCALILLVLFTRRRADKSPRIPEVPQNAKENNGKKVRWWDE